MSIGNINIYVELDKTILNIQTLTGKTQYLPYSALLLETDAYVTESALLGNPVFLARWVISFFALLKRQS